MRKLIQFFVVFLLPAVVLFLGWPLAVKAKEAAYPQSNPTHSSFTLVLGIVTVITCLCGLAGFALYNRKDPNEKAAETFMTMFKLGFGGLVGLLGGGALNQ